MSLSSPQNRSHAPGHRAWWPLTKRVLTWVFFILVGYLLVSLARNLDWQEANAALRSYRPATLLLALVASAASYLVYSSFDLLGQRYARHRLPRRQILPVTFVCYAFNLNFGAWVGGLAFRYRLYSRLGLDNLQITKVYTLSLTTNWVSYLLLAGLVFTTGAVVPPGGWDIGPIALRALGLLLLSLAIAYLLLCAFSRRRSWTIRGHGIGLPSLRLAVAQILLGSANWMLMALIIHLLLPQQIGYPTVLGVLLISSIAGVITHIPAGLGVLEAVFIAMLQHETSRGSLLAALIGYRVIYYLLPLLVATIVYLGIEARARKMQQENRSQRG